VVAVDVKEINVDEIRDETVYEEVKVAVELFEEELYVAVEILDGVVSVGIIEEINVVELLNELTDDKPVVFVGIDEEINVAVELVEDEAELIKEVIGEAEIAMV